MRIKLSYRFNLYIGGLLILGLLLHVYHDISAEVSLLERMGVSEADELSKIVFDELYTSMRLGGGRMENRAIIERFRNIEPIDEVRVLHGAPLDKQYGTEDDEVPTDELERAALDGKPGSMVIKEADGHMSARVVMPVFLRKECASCHLGAAGAVNGAISLRISLGKYENIFASHIRDLLLWGGGTFLLALLAVLFTVQRRLLGPIERLKQAAEAISEGDLTGRVGLKTGDELEDLGNSFDRMAESLHAASARIKDLSERHSMLVEMAVDGIILKDLETGVFVEANPAALALTGYARDELTGMRPQDIYPPEEFRKYSEACRRWVYDGKGYFHDAEAVRKDGTRVPVEIAASIIDINGRKYVQEIWRDLSERKGFGETIKRHIDELENAVKHRTSVINASLKELEYAYGRLKESEQSLIQSAKLRSLGEMGAGIAHELNSPLAGILSITEVLLGRAPKDDPNRYLLEKIKDAAVRSKYIILDMLTFSRPPRDGFSPMFLNEAIKATLCLFISEIKTSSIEIIEDLEPGLPRIMGSKGQIMEVILNIIKNARDAMEGGGRIFISTRSLDENGALFVAAEIRDTGPGIPDEIRDKIFDPFFTTKQKGGGLNIGLGLSISHSIVKEHGGRIEIGGRHGEGALFRVVLPAIREEA